MVGQGFVRAKGGEAQPKGDAQWFVFVGQQLLLRDLGDGIAVPVAAEYADLAAGAAMTEPLYIGRLDGQPCMAARSTETQLPAGYVGHDLRALYGLVPDLVWWTAGLAFQLSNWAAHTRFCPRTGRPTHVKPGEWAMTCDECNHLQYPTISPCVIVLVHDGDRILMTRQASWPAGRYGLVAGFVEPGETLEQCLEREVREETAIAVSDIRYLGSQPWPFPHQLMLGFTARYAGGDIVVDPNELEDARWFSVDDLPILPPPLSIARRIVDAHVAALRPATDR